MDTIDQQAICFEKSGAEKISIPLISEEPLSIRIQGSPYAVVMRTPGNEKEHVAGFCLAEGIVDSTKEIIAIGFCDGSDTNVITVTLTAARREKISGFLDRRGYISQTSCGICGKEIVEDLTQKLKPVPDGIVLDVDKTLDCLNHLTDHQPLRKKTKASHATVIYGKHYKAISSAEDVGRHNALDKAVGRLFLEERLDEAAFLTLSSRISYELVQKAARARIPVLLAISRPTALAVKLASELNMAVATLSIEDDLIVYCNPHRLKKMNP